MIFSSKRWHSGLFRNLGLFVILVITVQSSLAQAPGAAKSVAKKPVKDKVAKPKTPPVIDTIDIDNSQSVVLNRYGTINSTTKTAVINLPLIIKGKQPDKDVKIKLSLKDYSSHKLTFYTLGIQSNNITATISKNQFNKNGAKQVIQLSITLQYSVDPLSADLGAAYINLDGHADDKAYKIFFSKYIGFIAGGADTKEESTRPIIATKSKIQDTVEIVSASSQIQLDSFKTDIINQHAINLKLKLKKDFADNTTYKLKLRLSTQQSLTNIKLLTRDSVETISITTADWKSRDSLGIITKAVNIIYQQTDLVTQQQSVALSLQGITGNYLLTFKPFTGASKSAAVNLVKDGQASIVSAKNPKKISQDYLSPVNTPDTISVRVRLSGKFDPKANQLVFTPIDPILSKHFQILENPVTITEDEWTQAIKNKNTQSSPQNGGKETSSDNCDACITIPLHIRLTNPIDSLNSIYSFDLKLQGQTDFKKGSQQVKISVLDKPFWAEIGTNFDVLDKVQTNNFYAGVLMFDKNVGRFLRSKGKNNNLSLTGGVYESQSVSSGSSASTKFNYLPSLSATATYQTDTGVVKSVTSVKSVGLFFSPHVSIFNNDRVDEDGLHPFVSLYIEMLWQRVTSTFDYSKTTSVTPATTPALSDDEKSKLRYKQNSLSLDYRSHYIGVGLPLYIKHHDFTMYINWVPLGFTTQQFVVLQNSDDIGKVNDTKNNPIDPNVRNVNKRYQPISDYVTNNYNTSLINYVRPKNNWNLFYLVQFRLTEVAYGITFSGEVRSLYNTGSKPVITLALSKKFDLAQVLKPFVGKL